jgi:arabinogalactan endo-1,4-beta-galactosidase
MRSLLSSSLVLLLLGFSSALAQETSFYFGVDLSYVNEMDDCGAVYRENGVEQDAYALFAAHGANLVRARLWHNPDWTAYSNLEDVKRTFRRAQDAGMETLLDIHYSDMWADPSRQEIPAAWENIEDTGELATALYDYTYAVLSELNAENLAPAFVQVGNETNSGMMHAGGDLDWERQSQLFNAGIQAIRDFSAETNRNPKIILHIAQPENTAWWFSEAEAAGISDFDIIGISYYPQWSSFSITDMASHVSYLRQRFAKEVMVMETAYPWTSDAVDETATNVLMEGIRGYSFSPEGQYQFMHDLTQSLISNGALGVVYWEPAWVSTTCSTLWGQGSHWENATFFDFQNNNEVLEGIKFLNALNYAYPSSLVDGQLDETYGNALVEDATGDNLDAIPAFDLENLYLHAEDGMVQLAITIAGDIYSQRGNYFIYFDTSNDEAGATVDVANRPITVADPYKPEYRLDITIKEEAGTVSARYLWHLWTGDAWEEGTFTGAALITNSTMEIQFPTSLLNNPPILNIAVISSDRSRIHTAGDILGDSPSAATWEEAIVLDDFASLEPGE